MINDLTFSHERDSIVKLDKDYSENHTYLIDGISHLVLGYKSVTTYLSQFFEKFDAMRIIDNHWPSWHRDPDSKYYGLTKEEIFSYWEQNGADSRDKGTFMHKVFEDYVRHDILESKIPELAKFIEWYNSEVLTPLKSEYTVFGATERIIGNIDLIYINKQNEVCLVDYKRSEVPDSNSFGKRCSVLDLPDTNISKHALQLTIYKYLLEKYYGLEVKHIYNLYIKGDDYKFIERHPINIICLFGYDS